MLTQQDVFKRRPGHKNTPEAIKLIIANFIVISAGEALCFNPHHISWFFWVIVGGLVVYNFFSLRKNLEVYSKTDKITYLVSTIVIAALVVLVYFFQ
ncbi:MAG: hypothetical protein ACTHMI_07470 [Mucilaginibacter sp.]|uniref:hypothetical protein n=1 Tax=Mucilaginibacter sp. L3T2-6 TaxID=3062491 RepID=UPI00267662F0|nr:hypothetical protein [Mucilaginibacter sp. L3T2-6]MDO3640701.1 hypothetical protein [Mucilaginibacter sp. L3T2-6]MDV6212958.1 hypothetical protein [Mucilaginibacter sp. L3T2-6]